MPVDFVHQKRVGHVPEHFGTELDPPGLQWTVRGADMYLVIPWSRVLAAHKEIGASGIQDQLLRFEHDVSEYMRRERDDLPPLPLDATAHSETTETSRETSRETETAETSRETETSRSRESETS